MEPQHQPQDQSLYQPQDQPQGQPTEKIGRWRRGWILTKSSWHAFKLDKEVVWFPVLASVLSVIVIAAAVGAYFAINPTALVNYDANTNSGSFNSWTYESLQRWRPNRRLRLESC
jgi:hypothetical protein